MTFAEEQATAHGLQEVRLYTNEKMHENLAIYARLGFEETGRGLDGATGACSCASGFAEEALAVGSPLVPPRREEFAHLSR